MFTNTFEKIIYPLVLVVLERPFFDSLPRTPGFIPEMKNKIIKPVKLYNFSPTNLTLTFALFHTNGEIFFEALYSRK